MRDYFFFCHAVPTQPLFLQPHCNCAVCQRPLGGFFSSCYECISMLRQFTSNNSLLTNLHTDCHVVIHVKRVSKEESSVTPCQGSISFPFGFNRRLNMSCLFVSSIARAQHSSNVVCTTHAHMLKIVFMFECTLCDWVLAPSTNKLVKTALRKTDVCASR